MNTLHATQARILCSMGNLEKHDVFSRMVNGELLFYMIVEGRHIGLVRAYHARSYDYYREHV